MLVLETLRRHPEIPAASVLLVGAPVRGCHAGRRFGRAGVGRWMMGACGQLGVLGFNLNKLVRGFAARLELPVLG